MKQLASVIIHKYWVDGLDRRLPVIVTLIAIVMLTHSLANLTWKLVPTPEMDNTALNKTGSSAVQGGVAKADQPLANKIASWHLFGKVEVEKPKPQLVQKVETAPDTKLNLKLRGVFASPNKKLARAIIADAKGKEDSYAIGVTLPGGAVLNQVFSDKVILEHNGRLETLRLPADDSGAVAGNSANNSARSRTSPKRPRTTRMATTGDTSTLLKQYRDGLLNDPQSVMGLIRAQPYQKDGVLKGYRIRPGKDRQLLRKFGLKSGDVVTAVNGVPMNNPIKALEVLRDLSTATQLTVDVERRGVPQSFTFSIDN